MKFCDAIPDRGGFYKHFICDVDEARFKPIPPNRRRISGNGKRT